MQTTLTLKRIFLMQNDAGKWVVKYLGDNWHMKRDPQTRKAALDEVKKLGLKKSGSFYFPQNDKPIKLKVSW